MAGVMQRTSKSISIPIPIPIPIPIFLRGGILAEPGEEGKLEGDGGDDAGPESPAAGVEGHAALVGADGLGGKPGRLVPGEFALFGELVNVAGDVHFDGGNVRCELGECELGNVRCGIVDVLFDNSRLHSSS